MCVCVPIALNLETVPWEEEDGEEGGCNAVPTSCLEKGEEEEEVEVAWCWGDTRAPAHP